MSENKHTISDLYQMQGLSLKSKVIMTVRRINEWYERWDGNVYVSFSGGKDSTVLVDLVHNVCGLKDVPLVYIDTGLEYPEVRWFVQSYGDKVTWLKPEKNFKEILRDCGYPFISKEVSGAVGETQVWLDKRGVKLADFTNQPTNQPTNLPRDRFPAHHIADFLGIARRGKAKESKIYLNLKKGIIPSLPVRAQMLNGTFKNKDGQKSIYNKEKWMFMVDGKYKFSNRCCDVMKKAPAKKYGRKTGRKPITGVMASESRLRTTQWLKNGCNAFDLKSPVSNPMSFWTEQDVLLYIKLNNLPIASVYGEIVEDLSNTDMIQGQMTMSDIWEGAELFDAKKPPLKTTGCYRTGCVFCGYGCHLEKPGEGRFERLKYTHPAIYDYIFRPTEEGGLGYKEVIDWLNENGNLNIRY